VWCKDAHGAGCTSCQTCHFCRRVGAGIQLDPRARNSVSKRSRRIESATVRPPAVPWCNRLVQQVLTACTPSVHVTARVVALKLIRACEHQKYNNLYPS
jgi:hypothetical protein